MNFPSGKRLERLVAAIEYAASMGADVRWNDNIEGRQFDVTVRFRFGVHSYLAVLECKDYNSKVSVEKIDAFVTKARDARANKAIIISSHGFQSGCFAVAERHGIELLTLNETVSLDIQHLVDKIIPGLNIYNVRFAAGRGAGEYRLEEEGGRLTYLMKYAKVFSTAEQKTPDQIISEWWRKQPAIEFGKANEVEIKMPFGSELQVPYEDSYPVASLRFSCALVEVAIPKIPLPDTHILEGMSTTVELHDVEGNVKHMARLADLEMGFDAPVEVGKFYLNPAICSRYYCEEIQGDSIKWVMIESYQHGHLVQAVIRQSIKYSRYYVEVKDASTLRRLRAMHKHLESRRKK